MATRTATITMTMREADRLKTIQAVVDRMLRVGQAAQRLGISRRQVERIVKRYAAQGAAAAWYRASAAGPATINRALIHRYIDVYEYPEGRIELRADGVSLAYERYDRLPQVDTAAIVENKRLSHVLQTALVIQAQRDDRRKSSTPSRTNQGQEPYATKAVPGKKRSRQFTPDDLELAIRKVGDQQKLIKAPALARSMIAVG